MREMYSYTFETEMGWDEMLTALDKQNLWKWGGRDSDRWGWRLATRVLAEPHYGNMQLVREDGEFCLRVGLRSGSENTIGVQFLFDSVREVVLREVLPAIRATNIKLTDYLEK